MSMQRSSSRTQERKEQALATILGASSFQEVNWRTLMQQGVLIKLTISHCGFAAKLGLDDLGISVADERERQALARTLRLGEKRLLPEEYHTQLGRLESGARRALRIRSFSTELGAFLPRTAYDGWKEENEAYQARYFAFRDELIEKHQELVRQLLAEYEIVARSIYQRLRETRPDLISQQSETSFLASYCNRVAALIPDPSRIEQSFGYQVRLRESLAEVQALEVAQEASAAGMLTPQRLRAEAEQVDWQSTTLERDLRAQAQEQKKAMIDSFLTALVGELRTSIYEVMTDVLSTLEKQAPGNFSGRSVGRSVMQLKNLVKQIETLNFYGDREIEAMMREVQEVIDLDPARRERSLPEIKEKMRAIATVTRETLLSLGVEPRSGREVGILDIPSPGSVRAARLELGLDTEALAAALPEAQPRLGRRLAPETVPLWEPQDERPARLLPVS
jgi:hypothetical protein